MVESSGHFSIIGIERRYDALSVQDRAVVRDGVLDLKLVGPPIAETRAASAVFSHLIGHLVALEDVGKGVDGEAHGIGHVHQHVDFVLAVAVAGDKPLFVQDLSEGLQLQIPARRRGQGVVSARLAAGIAHVLPVVLPRLVVLTRPVEMVVVDLLHPHSCLGEAGTVVVAPIALLDVFTQRKLDER